MQYIIDYDVCAFLIAAVTMSSFFFSPRLHNRQETIYALVGVDILVICVLDVVTVLLDGAASDGWIMSVNMLYLMLFHALPCAMLFYLLEMTGSLPKLPRWLSLVILLPYGVELGFLLTAPFNGLVIQVANGHYFRGPFSFIFYAAGGVYILFSLVEVLRAMRRVPGRRLLAAGSFLVLQAATALIQVLEPAYLLVNLAAAMSLLIMYIALHTAAEITDPLTGAYNEQALLELIGEQTLRQKPYLLLGCRLEGLHDVNQTYTKAAGDGLLQFFARELDRCLGGKTARIYGDRFCVLLTDCAGLEELDRRAARLPTSYHYKNYEIDILAAMPVLDSRDYAGDAGVLLVMDFAFERIAGSAERRTRLIDRTIWDAFKRREQVNAAIVRALHDQSIDVVFQPIVDAKTGCVCAAEALARLTDSALGAVTPDEFVPLAEQNGTIIELSAHIRAKVWALVKDYDLRAAGLDHVAINLSVVECMQTRVMDALLAEAADAATEAGLVCLEITETAAAVNPELLLQNMNRMKAAGFDFHLDDYGTGYAGMQNLLRLPVSVVKLDRSLLSMAEEDAQRGELVRGSIAPFHDFGIRIVCEGVESEAQAEIARGWGADYLQGFLYARPMPAADFLAFAGIPPRKQIQ